MPRSRGWRGYDRRVAVERGRGVTTDLRVTLVQADTVWHAPEANRDRLAAAIAATAPSDVIVLPETFTSGFSNDALTRAEEMDGPTVAWMRA